MTQMADTETPITKTTTENVVREQIRATAPRLSRFCSNGVTPKGTAHSLLPPGGTGEECRGKDR